jgi:NTP pyrophosphatase (non-canonical NTP hydrolase)
MTLEELQQMISRMYSRKDNARGIEGTFMWLMEEVGELARIMSRKYGDQSFKAGETGDQLADEMADVLWVLVCLANQTGIDLTKAIELNMQKKTDRDAERHKNNDKLH